MTESIAESVMREEERVVERDTETDEELRKILESRKAEIKVVGAGGTLCRGSETLRNAVGASRLGLPRCAPAHRQQ